MPLLPEFLSPRGGHATAYNELRLMRTLLLAGCLAIALNGSMEMIQDHLAPWDAWAYPVMFSVFGSSAVALHLWPDRERLVRRLTVATFNGYLVFALYMGLFWRGGPPDDYQLISNLYWVPLGYGGAFVFLRRRDALLVSSLTYLFIFAPMGWLVWQGRSPQGALALQPLLTNTALAQLIYLVLLVAISSLRSDYLRTRERAELMRQVAHTDALTGIANRRSLNESLVAGISLMERHGQAFSLLLLDVDGFKQINDQHGHVAGDAVLVALAALMSEQLRPSDQLGRWGGEEFLVVVPATPLASAVELAERIRQGVADHPFGLGQAVTVSLGVAQGLPGETPEQLVARSDRALYAAKRAGRNRVVADPGPSRTEAPTA